MILRSVIGWLSRLPVLLGALSAFCQAASLEIVVQRGPDLEATAVVYSPDGRVIASAGESEAIRLWDRASGDLVKTLPGHAERVTGLDFSPDGRWLASSSTDGSVKVWDYRAGQLVHLFTNHIGNWVRRVAFSRDSRWLAPAAYDGKMSLWDVASGAVVRTLPTRARIADVLFTPDGRFVVTASREENSPLIRFWSTATGEPALTLNHSNALVCIAISRDGKLLASGGGQGVVNLWELPAGRWLRRVVTAEQASAMDIDLSPDGRRLAVAGYWENTVWATDTGALLSRLRGHEDATMQVAFSPDGRELASSSADASVRLWNVRNGSVKHILARRPPNTPVTSVAFSADGRFEALGTVDGIVRVWSGNDGSFRYELRGHEGPVLSLGFSADGAWLYSGSADRTMRVWDMAHGSVAVIHPYFDRVDAMGTLAVGGTQGWIASASGPLASPSLDHSIKLWSAHSDRPLRILNGHVASVRSVAFTPGSDLLASASVDGTVKLWNARSGDCLRTLTNTVFAETLTFLPGARWLAAGMADGAVRILETNFLSTVREWRAHSRPVQTLALSGDSRWLATAGADRTVAIWDWETGRELRRFTNVSAQYLPLAFHPRQPVLAFAQRDETVVHASIETGEILFQRTLFPHGEWLAWNPSKAFYMASPHGEEHARLRFSGQLVPVYPLQLYRSELRRTQNLLAAIAGPAPALAPKNFALWWYRYPHKRAWLDFGLAVTLPVVVFYLWRGWRADRQRRAQESFSRQLLISQEAERKRIAGELHDSLGQNLLIIKNRLYLAQQAAAGTAPAGALAEISQTVSQTIQEVREISYNLRPYQLDRLGLTKAVQSVVQKVAVSRSLSIESHIANIDGIFPSEGEISFYRIVQESLNNIVKHSDAATARIAIEASNDQIRMSIADDGRGFDYHGMMHDQRRPRGFGLTGLGERVRILGGHFTCDSAPGRGTRLTFELPIPPNNEKDHPPPAG